MFTPPNYPYGRLNLQFLDSVGDGSGSIDMTVDGSVTPQEFSYVVPTGHWIQLESIGVFIYEDGNIQAGNYGGLPKLANGVRLELRQINEMTDITVQLPIRSNADWLSYTFDVHTYEFAANDSILSLSYNLNMAGRPIRLDEGESFVVIINDDLSALFGHRMRLSFVLGRKD